MKYQHKTFHCELLQNDNLFNYVIKLFYLILKKLKMLQIPNIETYFNVHLLDNKFTKENVIQTNGINCEKTNLCEPLLHIDNYNMFYRYIKTNNINIMQITGIIYQMSSSEIICRNAMKHDKILANEIIFIYNELFGDTIKTFDDLENLANKSEGNWFLPLLYIYGKEKRTNIVSAGLNYDKVYIREALDYSRPIVKDDFHIYKIKNNDCFKTKFDENKLVLGDSYFKIVKNGVFENTMKKHNKEIISGYSGSAVMVYNFVFNILKIFKKSVKNELLLLLMLILDFYPIHHSISEILVTYSRESKYLTNYYLDEDEIKYIKKYSKQIKPTKRNVFNKTKKLM